MKITNEMDSIYQVFPDAELWLKNQIQNHVIKINNTNDLIFIESLLHDFEQAKKDQIFRHDISYNPNDITIELFDNIYDLSEQLRKKGYITHLESDFYQFETFQYIFTFPLNPIAGREIAKNTFYECNSGLKTEDSYESYLNPVCLIYDKQREKHYLSVNNQLYFPNEQYSGNALRSIEYKKQTVEDAYLKINFDFRLTQLNPSFINKAVCKMFLEKTKELSLIPKAMRDKELCEQAVILRRQNIYQVPNKYKTYELYKKLVQNHSRALYDVPNQYRDYNMCFDAISTDGASLKYVPDHILVNNPNLFGLAADSNPEIIDIIPKQYQTRDFIERVVLSNPSALYYFEDKEIPEHVYNSLLKSNNLTPSLISKIQTDKQNAITKTQWDTVINNLDHNDKFHVINYIMPKEYKEEYPDIQFKSILQNKKNQNQKYRNMTSVFSKNLEENILKNTLKIGIDMPGLIKQIQMEYGF